MAIEYSIEYTLKDKDGNILDSNVNEEPLKFKAKKGHIIPKLEEEIEKMEVGQTKKIFIPAKDGYGEYDENMVQIYPREDFTGINLQKGMTIYGETPEGEVIGAVVKDFNDKEVVIDFNHPLAGKDLYFEVKLVDKKEVEDSCNCGSCGCHS